MRRIMLLCTLLLLLTACREGNGQREKDFFDIYLPAAFAQTAGGDGIAACTVSVAGGDSMEPEVLASALVTQLIAAQAGEVYGAPLPAGIRLMDLTIENGCANIDFSSEYTQLSGIALTIADSCLLLTLSQLDEVEAISVTANRRPLPYRRAQILRLEDIQLTQEESLRNFSATLYYRDESGALCETKRELTLFEGQTRYDAVIDALRTPPEGGEGLSSVLPSDMVVLSLQIEEEICYLNLSQEMTLPPERTAQEQMVHALVYSLCALDSIETVQILVDGQIVEKLGEVWIGEPLRTVR